MGKRRPAMVEFDDEQRDATVGSRRLGPSPGLGAIV